MNQPHRLPRWVPLVAVVLAGLPACRVTSIPIWGPALAPDNAAEVETIADIPYGEEPEPGSQRRHLDLFLPKDRTGFPVVLLVHGGAWMVGDNCCCGLYSAVGTFLAQRGIGAVLPNYRLSPGVKHPEHIKDVARAFAWVHAHLGAYGGCAEKIFVAGHSAGGHLAALLATDDTWLHEVGLNSGNIAGAIVLSGVYHIPEKTPPYTLGGWAPLAFRLGQVLPLRCQSGWCGNTPVLPGIPMPLNVFGPVFGDDPKVRADASPINHVRPGLPPFLIVYGEHDLPTLPDMAEEFHNALRNHGCASTLLMAEKRNHNSTMFKVIEENDPIGNAIIDFIYCHAPGH